MLKPDQEQELEQVRAQAWAPERVLQIRGAEEIPENPAQEPGSPQKVRRG